MTEIQPTTYIIMYAVSYSLAWYTWKDEKGWLSRILKFLLTGLIPIVSLMLFVWKLLQDDKQEED